MAIDKRKAGPWLRFGIASLAVIFVAGMSAGLLPGLFSLATGPSGAGGSGASGGLDAIAAERGSQVRAFEQVLASDPASYTALVGLGNAYFDWALAVQEAKLDDVTNRAYWSQASAAYQQALAVQPGDPNVSTDLAISLYYGQRVNEAISTIEGVLAAKPDFAPAMFNAGIFYRTAGRDADALRMLEAYVKADPEGSSGNIEMARQWIGELAGGSGSATPAVPSTTAP